MNSLSDLDHRSQQSQSNQSLQPKRWMRWQFVVAPNDRGSAEIGRATCVHRTDCAEPVPQCNLLKSAYLKPGRQADAVPQLLSKPQTQSAASSESNPGMHAGQLESLFQEVSYRLSDDLCPVLFSASDALSSIVNRIQQSTYLSKADLQVLKGEVSRLGLFANWSDSTSLQALIGKKNLPQFRTRFSAANFMDSLASSIAELCATQSVEIEWEGWHGALPKLYADPYQLSFAMVNIIASVSATCSPGGTIKIQAFAPADGDGSVMVQIVSPKCRLSWEAIRLINGMEEWLPTRIADRGFLAAKRLIKGIGGHLSAVNQSDNELTLRITIPSDSPQSLLQSWISPISRAGTANTFHQIRLFAVRCEHQFADLMNHLLHRKATTHDLVIRVTSNRWLILEWHSGFASTNCSVEGRLPTAESSQPRILKGTNPGVYSQSHSGLKWLSSCVYQSVRFRIAGSSFDGRSSLTSVTRDLIQTVQRLVDSHQLIIESLTPESLYSFRSPNFSDVFNNVFRQLPESAKDQTAKDRHDDNHSGEAVGPSAEFLASVIHRWKSFQSERFVKVG